MPVQGPNQAVQPGLRRIDFANYTHRVFDRDADLPPTFQRLTSSAGRWITLKNGKYEVDSPVGRDWVRVDLRFVSYGDVTGDGQEEALVALRIGSGGTQEWSTLFVYAWDGSHARLIDAFWTGDRANEGLHRVYAEEGRLVTEIYDAATAVGDCCASGILRVRSRWSGRNFVEVGRETVALSPPRDDRNP